MRVTFFFFFILFCCQAGNSQTKKSGNIVIVTLDGYRWQELFGGADSLLTFDTAATYSTAFVQKKYWAPTSVERRKKLMPFMWGTIAAKGLIAGNRFYGNKVNNANPYWFSYPGYNEIFTGYPDKGVNSNDKIPNPNENVLEHLNKKAAFKGKVAAFGSWDVYSSILNEKRSGFVVNDGFKDLQGKLTEKQQYFNTLQHQLPDLFHGGERLDIATFSIGFEYLKVNKPRVIYFGFGDTDEFAHAGQYDYYLDAANNTDGWLQSIWQFIESTPGYAGNTTMIITTDHGRGSAKDGMWKHHGEKTDNSNEIWFAAIGPSIPSGGELKVEAQFFQGQIAATIAQLLGEKFTPAHTPLTSLNIIPQ